MTLSTFFAAYLALAISDLESVSKLNKIFKEELNMKKNAVRLSELPSGTEISIEESHEVVTAGDLRNDLLKDGDLDLVNANWSTIERKQWKPCAVTMVTGYIEQQYDEMYEDWDERAMDCIKDEHFQKIQNILNEAFAGDSATAYWSYEKDVIIDTPIKN